MRSRAIFSFLLGKLVLWLHLIITKFCQFVYYNHYKIQKSLPVAHTKSLCIKTNRHIINSSYKQTKMTIFQNFLSYKRFLFFIFGLGEGQKWFRNLDNSATQIKMCSFVISKRGQYLGFYFGCKLVDKALFNARFYPLFVFPSVFFVELRRHRVRRRVRIGITK